jgi:hypothetical protein
MGRIHDIEGPVEDYGCFHPDGAEKMPTKHYATSTREATKGKKTEIEGPCNEHGSEDGYHK